MTTADNNHEKSTATSEIDFDSFADAPMKQIDDATLFAYAQSGQTCTNAKGESLLVLDEKEEAQLRRKFDVRLLPIIAVVHLFFFIDKSNLGNARIAGLEDSLQLEGFDYNFLQMSYSIAHCLSVLPLVCIAKRFGLARVLPLCVFMFGTLTFAFSFINTFKQAIALRALLAIFESPVIAGFAIYVARFYRRSELAIRVAIFISAAPVSGAIGGLLASAILEIRSIGTLTRWRQIYLVEGLITIFIAFVAFCLLPSSIDSARWLTQREKALAIVRIKSENVALTDVQDKLSRRSVQRGMLGLTPILLGFVNAVLALTAQSIAYMLPSIMRSLFPNRTIVQMQLLTTPPYFSAIIITLISSFIVTKYGRFTLLTLVAMMIGMTGYIIAASTTVQHSHARYAATFLIVIGAFMANPVMAAWTLANNTADSERAGAMVIMIIMTTTAHIGAAFAYVPSDKPNYHRANTTNAVLCSVAILVVSLAGYLLRRENRMRDHGKRDERLDGLSAEEQETLGHHHPAFRYVH